MTVERGALTRCVEAHRVRCVRVGQDAERHSPPEMTEFEFLLRPFL